MYNNGSNTYIREVTGKTYVQSLYALRKKTKVGDDLSVYVQLYNDEYSPVLKIVHGKIVEKYNKFIVLMTDGGWRECFLYQDIKQ